ncbi:GGDEF domain-containing phosphodiesterase [Halanaerobium sp.]|uniref:GGDEF domain-containing phosphodiesterase n=1 Tax=Halanaerobium sp. TaxID=1895664 RepID=UPI000DE79666|nr:GGDEF domain-containing phosphodiesterase [Halanaerobium sp.]PUU90161.1 MAG: diguanylate cyclase/phosphodiesterase [Halanaerobium sp.]
MESKTNNKELFELAYYDELTNLKNEKFFYEILDKKINQINLKTKLYVVYLKINNIDQLDNFIGYQKSNDFIRELADKISRSDINAEIISIYKGNQFLILFENITYTAVNEKINKLVEDVILYLKQSGYYTMLNINVGISIYPDHAKDPEGLISKAHHAMLILGKKENDFQVFNNDIFNSIKRSAEIREDLEKAIENEDLYLKYHPKLDINNDKIIALEALLRWEHGQKGQISPGEFIPIAENNGMTKEIDLYVLKKVFEQLNNWLDKDYGNVRICINVSASSLKDLNFINEIKEISDSYELNNNLIEIEITERAIIDIPKKNIMKLQELDFLLVLDVYDNLKVTQDNNLKLTRLNR